LAQEKIPEAEKLMREALATHRKSGGAADAGGYLQASLALILTRQGKYAEAETEIREALGIFNQTLPADHQYVAAAEYVLGEVLLETHRLSDAEATLTASMNRWKRTDAAGWRAARSASALGDAIYRQNSGARAAEAEKYLVDGFTEIMADKSADQDTRNKARKRITHFYTDRGQRQKLDELMLATNVNRSDPRSRTSRVD
jgi:tetratricopeptide (TPR) repeat protein